MRQGRRIEGEYMLTERADAELDPMLFRTARFKPTVDRH